MDTQDLIYKIQEAQHEIRSLRQSNQILQARAEVFDGMMLLFTSQPNFRTQGMSPDVVYVLEKYIDELKAKLKPQPVQAIPKDDF